MCDNVKQTESKAMFIPNHSGFINSSTGDGFLLNVLPTLMTRLDLLIAPKEICTQFKKDQRVKTINVESLHKFPSVEIKRVLIKTRLPRAGSKSMDMLMRFCTDKVVVFLDGSIFDYSSMQSALMILQHAKVHKDKKLSLVNYNRFMHFSEG